MELVAFTGAGISAASGIPTFESWGGFSRHAVREYWRFHPEDFFAALLRNEGPATQPRPTPPPGAGGYGFGRYNEHRRPASAGRHYQPHRASGDMERWTA
jgi:hypothetical protein